jgi:hypothetical protein
MDDDITFSISFVLIIESGPVIDPLPSAFMSEFSPHYH